jgi:rubrerythrin
MKLFLGQENRIKCGQCGTEFDLNINKDGCPLCGFGKNFAQPDKKKEESVVSKVDVSASKLPTLTNLKSGSIKVSAETKIWGSWLMFNDVFAPKFVCRILIWKLFNEKKEQIILKDLMNEVINSVRIQQMSKYKGFPNLKKDPNGSRIVNHFLMTFYNLGLIDAKILNEKTEDIWQENWNNISITITKEGYEFAQLQNNLLDYKKEEQILTIEEKNWLIKYFKKIDEQGYKEYSTLKEVYEHLKNGKNGNIDLWTWFENNKKISEYVKSRSKKAQSDEKIFKQQLSNYAKTFSSAKISLLRELGVVKDKRGDYTIIGEL